MVTVAVSIKSEGAYLYSLKNGPGGGTKFQLQASFLVFWIGLREGSVGLRFGRLASGSNAGVPCCTGRAPASFSPGVAYNRTTVTKKPFTAEQGQYLAFIFYYTKIHGFAPAESDMQNYFKVSPPSVHQMVVTLEANGFIERVPGRGRSIRVLIPREELPDLE